MRSLLIEFIPCGNDEENIEVTSNGFADEDLLDAMAHAIIQLRLNGYTMKHVGELKRIK